MNYYVYKFLDKEGNALYVGQTIDIDRRMSEHKGKIWDIEKDHIEYAKCENMADMCLYEMYYINKLHAKYNDCLVYDVEPTIILPDLNFERYDTSLVDKIHNEVMQNARNDFAQRFEPTNYWQTKKETLEKIIENYSKESEEYKNTLEKINKCDEMLKQSR